MVFERLSLKKVFPAILTTVCIILFYFFFNLNYLSNWIDEKGDARTYNYYIKLGIPKYLYNPHHLYFDRLGQWLYEIAIDNGYTGSSMRVLQLRNLVISSVCLGLIFFFFYLFSKKYILSLLFTLMIAFSCAVWIYAQINDTGLLHSILLILLFFSVVYFPYVKRKYLYSLFLGSFHGIIVIVFHQSDIIFICIIFFIMVFVKYMKKDKSCIIHDNTLLCNNDRAHPLLVLKNTKKGLFQKPVFSFKFRKIRYFLLYLMIFLVIVIASYYYIGIVVLHLTLNPEEADYFNQIKGSTYFFNWIILYSNINFWGKGFLKGNLFDKVVKGITSYFYQPGNWEGKTITWDFNSFAPSGVLLPNLIIIFIFLILACSIIFCIPLYRMYTYVFISIVLYLVIYVLFACWWEPDYREFWIAPLFGFWLIAFLVVNFILKKLTKLWPLPHYAVYVYLFVVAGLLFYFNFTNLIYPKSSTEFRVFNIINDNQ